MAKQSSLNRKEMIQEGILEHHEQRNNMVKRIQVPHFFSFLKYFMVKAKYLEKIFKQENYVVNGERIKKGKDSVLLELVK